MEPSRTPPVLSDASVPPRAFTQGVGLVFQWVGVLLFLLMMFVCCTSSLLSKDTATHTSLTSIGTTLPGGAFYSAQLATTLTVALGVLFGIALAGIGLGLQAQRPETPAGAITINVIALVFWICQMLFFATVLRSIILALCCAVLALVFGACLGFSIGAAKEMRRDPPPKNMEILPADYKVSYSHMHQDPPDVRLAAELESRRRKLEVQQKELESLEQKLKRRMKDEQS